MLLNSYKKGSAMRQDFRKICSWNIYNSPKHRF